MDNTRENLKKYVPLVEYFIHSHSEDKQKLEKLKGIVALLKDPKLLEEQKIDPDELSKNIKLMYAQCRDPKTLSKFKNIFQPSEITSPIELSDSSDDEIEFYPCTDSKPINNKLLKEKSELDIHNNDKIVELISTDEELMSTDDEKISKNNPENHIVNKQQPKNYAKKSTSLFTRRQQTIHSDESDNSSFSAEYNNLSSDDECERLQMFERRDNKEKTITKVMEELQFNTVPPITIDSNPIIIDSESDNDVNEKNKSTNSKSIEDLQEKDLDELQKLRCDIESQLNPVINLYQEPTATKFDMIPQQYNPNIFTVTKFDMHIPLQYNPNISIVPPPLPNIPKVNPNDPRCKNRQDVLYNTNIMSQFEQQKNNNTQFFNILNKPLPQINVDDILNDLEYKRPPVSSVQQHKGTVRTTYGDFCRRRKQEIDRKKAEFEARRKKEEYLVDIAKSKVPINENIPTSESVMDKMYRKKNQDTNDNLPNKVNNFRIPKKAAEISSNIIEANNTDQNTSSQAKTKVIKPNRKSSLSTTDIETSLTEVTAVGKSTIIDNNTKTTEKGKNSISKRRNTISERRNSKSVTEKSVIPKSSIKNTNNCIVKLTKTKKKTIPNRRKTISERRSSNVLSTPAIVAEEKSILRKSCKTNNKKFLSQSSSDSDSTDTTIRNPRRKRCVRRIHSSDSDHANNESSTLSQKKILSQKESIDVTNNINVVEYIKNLNEDEKTEAIHNVYNTFGDYVKDIKTTNVKTPKRKNKNELEKLFDDIDQMYDRNLYLSITGKRSCQANKKRVHSDDENQLIENEPKKPKLIARRKSCMGERCKISDDELTDDNRKIEKKSKKAKLTRRKSCFVERSKVSDCEFTNNLPTNINANTQSKPPNDEDYDTDDFSAHREQKKLQKRPVFKLPIKEVRISINRLTNEEILKYTKKSSAIVNNILAPLKAKPINKITRRQSTRKVSNYLNTNSLHHCENIEIINSCLLCGRNSKNIVGHYVNIHDEVFISRLSKTTIDFYKKNINYSYLAENSSTKYQVYCIFCKKNCIDSQLGFYEHYASHTGEFAYQCNKERCEVKYPYKKQMKQHCKTVHKNTCDYQQLYNYNFDKHIKINISICNICNYVQLNNANVTKHLKTQHDISTNAEDYVNELILVEFKTLETNELSVEIENENIIDNTQNYINNKYNINNSKESNFEHENSSDIDIGCANDELIETIVKEENEDDLDQLVNDAINKKQNAIITTISYSKTLNINNQFQQFDSNEIDKKPILSELSEIFNQQNHKLSNINNIEDHNANNDNIKIEIPTLHEEQPAVVSVIQPPIIIVNCESQSMNKSTPDTNRPKIVGVANEINENLRNSLESLSETTSNSNDLILNLDSDESINEINEINTITEISNESTKADIGNFQISKIPSTVNNMFDIRIDQINSKDQSEKIEQTSLKPWINNGKFSTDASIILNNINYFNLYKCMCCSYTASNELDAIVHYNNHNKSSLRKNDNNKLWLECPYCENISNSSIELVKHITTEHGYCNYQCPKCYYRSCSIFSVTIHQKLLDSHKDCEQILKCSNIERSVEQEFQDIIESRNKFVKSYSCHLCHDEQKFYIIDCLKKHIQTNHKNVLYCGCNNDNIFACIFCYFENNDRYVMINHIVNSHPNKSVIACARIWNSKYKNWVSDKVESTYLVLLGKNSKSKKEIVVDINTYKNKTIDNNFYERKKLLKICASNTNDSLIDFKKLKVPNTENTEPKIQKSLKELEHEFIELADIYISKITSNIGKKANTIDQKYNCTICSKSYNIVEVLKIHFKKEHTLKQYYCYLCGKIEVAQNLMEKHFFVHHNIQCPRIREIFKNIETNETYNAAVPTGVFCNSNDLLKHMINVLKINNENNKKVKKSKEIITTEQENINNTISCDSLKDMPKYITDQKRYQCTEKNCKYFGRNENSSEGHFQQIHRRYTKFQCLFCSFNINNEIRDFKIIKDHLRMHCEIIYACCKCNFVYHMRQNVREHVRSKHHKSEMNITKIQRTITPNNILNIKCDTCLEDGFTTLNIAYCILCFKKILNPDNISEHLYNKHECNVQYQCRYCKKLFITQDEINNHITGDHKKVIRIRCLFEIDVNLNDKEIDNNKQNESLPIISNVISIAAIPSAENSVNMPNNNINIDKPNSIINDNEHLKQITATSTINSSNDLNKNQDSVFHILKKSNKNIESTSNPKNIQVSNISSTTNKYIQSSPEMKSIKNNLYKCNECEYKSKTYQNINDHIQIEHEKKKTTNDSNNAAGYHCDECGYLCEKKNNLIEHKISLHGSSLKPYKCNDCKLKFINVRLHQSHMMATHLQSSGFFCEKCEKFFDTNDQLLQHQKIKYGKVFARNLNNIKCKKCDKIFDNEEQLKEHENSEHFLYYCKECKFTCDSKTFLKVHYNEIHEKSINITNNKENQQIISTSLSETSVTLSALDFSEQSKHQSPSVQSLKNPISSVVSPVQSLVQSTTQKLGESFKQKTILLQFEKSTTSVIATVQEATTSANDSIAELPKQSSLPLPVQELIESSLQPVNVIRSVKDATTSETDSIAQLPIQSSVQKATTSSTHSKAQLPIQSPVPLPLQQPSLSSMPSITVITSVQKATPSLNHSIAQLPIQSYVPVPEQQRIQSLVQTVNQSPVQLSLQQILQLPVQPVQSAVQSSVQPPVQFAVQSSEQQPVQTPSQSIIQVTTPITGIRLVPIEKLVKPNLLNANALNQIDNIVSQQQTHHLGNQINSDNQSNNQSVNQSTNLMNIISLDMSCVMLPAFNFIYKNDIIYICNYCTYGFFEMKQLLEHWRCNHEMKTPFKYGIQRRVRCGHCTWTGTLSISKQHHLETHPDRSFYIRKNTLSPIKFECIECSFKTENENLLFQHMFNTHATLINQNELTIKFINNELLTNLLNIGYRTTQYKCNLCAYCCLGEKLFQDHLINVHNNNIENQSLYSKSYQNHIVYCCKDCNGFYNTINLAFKHLRENHTLPYFCYYCNESVRNYNELLIHYRSIHNWHDEYRYNCHRITDHYEIYTKKIYVLLPSGLVSNLSDLENTPLGNRNDIIKALLEIEVTELNSLSSLSHLHS